MKIRIIGERGDWRDVAQLLEEGDEALTGIQVTD
jgi:hypothetical protein